MIYIFSESYFFGVDSQLDWRQGLSTKLYLIMLKEKDCDIGFDVPFDMMI